LSTASGANGFRWCRAWPGWPPRRRFRFLPRRAWAVGRGGLTMSLEGGFEDVDESFRAEANCFSNCSIRANAVANCFSNSATRAVNRAHFRHGLRRIPMMRQFNPEYEISPIPIHYTVNGYKDPNNVIVLTRRVGPTSLAHEVGHLLLGNESKDVVNTGGLTIRPPDHVVNDPNNAMYPAYRREFDPSREEGLDPDRFFADWQCELMYENIDDYFKR
jgi:hypothetical protein